MPKSAPLSKPEIDRQRYRRVVAQHAPLIDLLNELYPPVTPSLNCTDREIGAYIGVRELINRLEHLRDEAYKGDSPGQLRTVLQGG